MVDETHKLQKDPPEGSRRVIEHELKRQSEKANDPQDKKGEAEGAQGSVEKRGSQTAG